MKQLKQSAIVPTVGRTVHFNRYFGCGNPLAAIVCDVAQIGEQYLLNLSVFDDKGVPEPAERVPLIQPGQEWSGDYISYCEWMPHQVKKATGSESGKTAAGTETAETAETAARAAAETAARARAWAAETVEVAKAWAAETVEVAKAKAWAAKTAWAKAEAEAEKANHSGRGA